MATKQSPKGQEQKKAPLEQKKAPLEQKKAPLEQKSPLQPKKAALEQKKAPLEQKKVVPEQKKVPVTAPDTKKREPIVITIEDKDNKKDVLPVAKGGKDLQKNEKDVKKDDSKQKSDRSRPRERSRSRDRGRYSRDDRSSQRKQEKEVCRNFLHNRCDRGALCKYYHPRSSSSSRSGPDDSGRKRSPVRAPGDDSGGRVVCRDFVRNMCKRGDDCRFYHPPSESGSKTQHSSWLTFCHDFQNGLCSRSDCRFFHVSKEDEAVYRATGEIAPLVVDQAVRKALFLDVALTGTRPTCKEFLKGICTMQNCRFRHLNQREYEDEVFRALQEEFEIVLGPPEQRRSPSHQILLGSLNSFLDPPKYGTPSLDFRDDLLPADDLRTALLSHTDYEPDAKRPRYFPDEPLFSSRDEYGDTHRRWDDRMDLDQDTLERERIDRERIELERLERERMQQERLERDRLDLNLTETERMMQEMYNLRNDNLDLRRNLEQKIGDLKDELRSVMQENASLRHENTKLQTAANEDTMVHKTAIEKLKIANNTLSEESRNAQELARRLEMENNVIRKALEVKQKTNNAHLEKRLDTLEKDNIQIQDALNKANANMKKIQEEKIKIENELSDFRRKSRNQPSGGRKDGQQNNSGFNQRNDYSRDTVGKNRQQMGISDSILDNRMDQDMQGSSGNARGTGRYGTGTWVTQGKGQYNTGYSSRGQDTRSSDVQGPNTWQEADQSLAWGAGGAPQSWADLKNQNASVPSADTGLSRGQGQGLLGEYQPVDDRMRQQNSSASRGTGYQTALGASGMSNMQDYGDQSHSQGSARGFKDTLQTGNQYSSQSSSRFDGRDYGLSGYDNETRKPYGAGNRSLNSSSHWMSGGSSDTGDGRGKGNNQSWNRKGKNY
nr:uncharacterized protein LOC123754346 [Procambarus clarkii]XP_045592611.1 uncharacterized protein LOC123754346 [Procambarus clarkii]XP_045592612.1 uncharacterized protein LOC123754346 [Procambarus clarkii]XP_045592613.1 uncharacterized protein LOC123754346 [Procambarus clarkii]XP_045592614.1 uncharacterized protein LOC123754346 [Procambarus clarkii]XP_045592615.1 uncharacterized protein LOC123754346 [Procambarus clarkii]